MRLVWEASRLCRSLPFTKVGDDPGSPRSRGEPGTAMLFLGRCRLRLSVGITVSQLPSSRLRVSGSRHEGLQLPNHADPARNHARLTTPGPRPCGPPRLRLPDHAREYRFPPPAGIDPPPVGIVLPRDGSRALEGRGAAGPDRVILLPHPGLPGLVPCALPSAALPVKKLGAPSARRAAHASMEYAGRG